MSESVSPTSSLRLILASASPRRRQLLREAGFTFDLDPADIDEDNYPPGLLPGGIAEYLAFTKTQVVAQRHPDDVVLGADTVVAFGDRPLGKPADAVAAREMLRLLSGTTHLVMTGVCVMHRSRKLVRQARVTSAVRMRPLTREEIDAYVATGNWEGKAGGYGIQDADPFVTRMTGCHTNIVGLPMTHAVRLLAEAGMRPAS